MRHLLRYRWNLLLFLVLVILVAGCTISRLLIPQKNGQSTLTQNQQRWANAQPPHYRYTLELSCLCPPTMMRPVIIEVNNGTTTSIRYVDGTPANPDFFKYYATIDKLFAFLQSEIGHSEGLIATYDPQLGYPTTEEFDYDLHGGAIEQLTFTVRDFEVLK